MLDSGDGRRENFEVEGEREKVLNISFMPASDMKGLGTIISCVDSSTQLGHTISRSLAAHFRQGNKNIALIPSDK